MFATSDAVRYICRCSSPGGQHAQQGSTTAVVVGLVWLVEARHVRTPVWTQQTREREGQHTFSLALLSFLPAQQDYRTRGTLTRPRTSKARTILFSKAFLYYWVARPISQYSGTEQQHTIELQLANNVAQLSTPVVHVIKDHVGVTHTSASDTHCLRLSGHTILTACSGTQSRSGNVGA